MSFTKTIEFANYTLNFGEDKVLLDAFDCIVFPSFFAQKYVRYYRFRFYWSYSSNNCIVWPHYKKDHI